MIEFIYHDNIKKEIASIKKRFRCIDEGLSAFERMSEVQFNPNNPKQIISPGKLHRVANNDV